MNTPEIIISIACILGLFFWYFYLKRSVQYDDFIAYVTPGDPIKFYIGEEKYYGKLVMYGERTCEVIDEFGERFEVFTEHIHPRFGHDYKAGKE